MPRTIAWSALGFAGFAVVIQPATAASATSGTSAAIARVSASEPSADQAIVRGTLAALREDYAVRAVRNALEAYRLTHGRWPEQLDELTAAGLIAPETLATLGGRAYYSLDRDQGPIFLAPERS